MAAREFITCCLLYLTVLCFSGGAALAAEDNAAAGGVPIPIELPQPSFGGTPLDYQSEHLEPPSFRMRKPFLAPKGTKNAALKKTVTTSE